jgi:hypothetical protein
MILEHTDVVALGPNIFKYLRWTYKLADAKLTDADFKDVYQRYSTNQNNFVALKHDGFYSVYVAVDD